MAMSNPSGPNFIPTITSKPIGEPTGEQPGSGYTWGGGTSSNPTVQKPPMPGIGKVSNAHYIPGEGYIGPAKGYTGTSFTPTPKTKPIAPVDRAHNINRIPTFF